MLSKLLLDLPKFCSHGACSVCQNVQRTAFGWLSANLSKKETRHSHSLQTGHAM